MCTNFIDDSYNCARKWRTDFMTMELNQAFKMSYNFGGVYDEAITNNLNTFMFFKRDGVTIVVFKH
jgi:hypothetical protein